MNVPKQQKVYVCRNQADITSAFKIGSKNSKDNYRPVRILPNVSKIFEKHLFKKMPDFLDKTISMYQCDFRKGFSAQHCPGTMEILKKSCNGDLVMIKENQFELL